jgi:hypothetical protein
MPVRREQIPVHGNEELCKAWRKPGGIRDQMIGILRAAERSSAGTFIVDTVHLERRATEPDTSYQIGHRPDERVNGCDMDGEVLQREHDTLFVATSSPKQEEDERLWIELWQSLGLVLESEGFPNINVEISHGLCLLPRRTAVSEDGHPLRELWEDLSPSLHRILGDYPVLRSIGHCWFGIYGPGFELKHRYVTIIAEVQKDSNVDWQTRVQMVREVLDSPPFAGRLDDVSLEVVRSGHRSPNVKWQSNGYRESEYRAALKRSPNICVGRSISALGDATTSGSTLGAIVELKDASSGEWQKYGLSSFRSLARTKLPRVESSSAPVLSDPVEDRIFQYGMKPNSSEHEACRFRVQQPAAFYINGALNEILVERTELTDQENEIRSRMDRGVYGSDSDRPKRKLREVERLFLKNQNQLDEASCPRLWSVGEIYAASGIRRSRKTGKLLDWALHTLDVPARASNSVCICRTSIIQVVILLTSTQLESTSEYRTIEPPGAWVNIFNPPKRTDPSYIHTGNINDISYFSHNERVPVNMLGATSGVTAGDVLPNSHFGHAAGVDQATTYAFREQADGNIVWEVCEDLAVRPTGSSTDPGEYGRYFCETGDEGALVMSNPHGDVLGMISGSHAPSGWGFFTGMAEIVEDIKEITGASDVRIFLD